MITFEKLAPKRHDRKGFKCGVPALDNYLQKYAGQDLRRNMTQVYVLSNDTRIIGYYSISAHSVSSSSIPSDLSPKSGYSEFPFLLLGRLAIDQNEQGKGYGSALIYHAFETTVEAAQKIGLMGMVVEAKNEEVATYYEGFGFMRSVGDKNRLLLPLKTMISFLEKA